MLDVYVIGSALPELAAALELAEVGLSVRVADWSRERDGGGGVRGEDVSGGSAIDAVVLEEESALPDPEGVLREFLEHVAAPISAEGRPHPGVRPRSVAPSPVLLRGAKGGWVPQPQPAALGIPAVPISSQAIAVLGGRAAARAYLDRVKPVLTIGKTHSLGDLVRARLGDAVVQRLVDPFVRERFGVDPDAVEVAIAAPGLNEALTRAGSLSGAVLANSERDVARETRVVPVAGWEAVTAELRQRLELYGAAVPSEARVATVRRVGEHWRIEEHGGAVVEARAVVAGIAARSVADAATALQDSIGGAASGLRELLPRRWRIEAVAGLAGDRREPGEPGQDGGAGEDGGAALRTVDLADSTRWAVRLAVAEGASRVARLSGPAFEASGDGRALPSEAELTRLIGEVLDAADLVAAGNAVEGGARAAVRAAPFVSVDERDGAERALAEFHESEPHLLVAGDVLHGGSLAQAVADARARAVALRRRLAGIAE